MFDFLIIGGGIAGISAAARLAPLGKVLLLEAEDNLAHHASGRSAALYEPQYGAAPVVELSRASEAYFRAAGDILTPRGMMLLGRCGEEADFNHDLKAMAFDPITLTEAAEILPIVNRNVVTMAAYADHAEDIDTDLLLQGFARSARAHGAEIVTKAKVTRLARGAASWHVTHAKGEAEARMVINAAGAWVDEIAKLAGISPLGFAPLRRSMARISAPEGMDVSKWPMTFGPGESFYMKPDAGALIVSPAEEDPVDAPHDAWADDMILAEGLARYEAYVTAPVTRLIASWAGLRTFAPDRVLVIGPDAADPSFFWLAGQGGYGFQTSPAASLLAADLIAGRQPELSAELIKQLAARRFA